MVDLLAVDVVSLSVKAERIMEALELFKGETRKMEEHKYACEAAGKQVETPATHPTSSFERETKRAEFCSEV